MFELCSAPCKALRFASPALSRGLRALTAPARSSPIGRYVMAGGVNAGQPTLARPTLIIGTAGLGQMKKVDERFAPSYPAVIAGALSSSTPSASRFPHAERVCG